jgi:2-dehydropantoate 2-reductase
MPAATRIRLYGEPLHILGAGSIGQLFAASIRHKYPSYPVVMLLREHHRIRLNDANMMTIHWKQFSRTEEFAKSLSKVETVDVPVEYLQQGPWDNGINHHLPPIRNLVVTTKAYHAVEAVQSVVSRMTMICDTNNKTDIRSEKPRIILLCNGLLSVREELMSHLWKWDPQHLVQLVLATTTHGAYREPSQTLVFAGYGQTFVEESAEDIGNLWNEVGLNCQSLSPHEMNSLLWKKLATNCVINPLSAIYQCTNGELLLEPSFPMLQTGMLNEIVQVVQAEQSKKEVTNDKIENVVPEMKMMVEDLRGFVNQVIWETKANKSSMYQDIIQGQRTEIDHLNGYVLRKGRDWNIECPINEEILQRVMELEKS